MLKAGFATLGCKARLQQKQIGSFSVGE